MTKTIILMVNARQPLSATRDGTLVSIAIGEGETGASFTFDVAQGEESERLKRFIDTLGRYQYEAFCLAPAAKGKATA